MNILSKLSDCGVVAVVRGDSTEEAIRISEACIKGGIKGIEVTFTVQDADTVIKELVSIYDNNDNVIIGAGTVLDAQTARIAILAGAEFIVSPSFDKETAKLCNLYKIPYMPGCMTITEMKTALEYGADIVKLFPGSAFGPDFVKAVKAPLPQVNIMPTGGVNLENIKEWIQNGCTAVGVGGNLIAPAKTGDFEQITLLARQYVEKVQEARVG
ncbi:bifunctional 4-hydroxy-2-oxoglutarate aldolase/2-dehydro-3-deoxy-phosphogluconate aldolase [Priestia endophytica]|jgi:2-dehydro-3-deoxyphosphogluconate aldolase/(4S)-4-hydroxy-2-oxoglutarate aldolase|uniref:2-dehydro-3-deoxyphosphogluconate aldolase / (4S)-4-hydroxy-2-oxoglutarate aldolase n=1 Tax=Priestia endophytica DSM 13796 TaxID=1121089 RepID=A0A1I5Z4B7_9BACI|nr:bifunctional 4-hydroxy-2-oxoglutarate aldolase/2-dehydro-3-deoxy-phosphogluconate aldolase [Priestia endophytica]KAB2495562.1 bifunctional 4-hydroxy-2-oxoglutarate aldolase/2-dehydro-3-deoxy-phosphogluconate aldolase [Priestia endophytica]KYG27808.1 ketohydroxyglutarate aldolase [Priestia endophytica]MBG9814170.1 ketohydroxyglutarate aldolase [Priestia endophytica]SFQ51290.1 2-dehydro-3-deoxyphosphogluconate aldolase / (4S)-4-hydroxy-2-oxoglutarate aldolase [Priestia endophytica DSM 13796]